MSEERWRCEIAADCTNEWYTAVMRGFGLLCAFLCMAGGAQTQVCIIRSSATWTCLHLCIFATGQKYSCNVCGPRFKSTQGMSIFGTEVSCRLPRIVVEAQVCLRAPGRRLL